MIELKHIEKTYTKDSQQVHALHHINLRVNKGDIFGLIGYSGAGKSTLIRLINLLEQPSSGEIWVDGVNIHTLSSHQQRLHTKKIGMIFQHFNLLETKTVAQNVAIPLILSGVNKKEVEQRVNDILAYVELTSKKESYPGQLSGGQKQRVGIARALITNPSILLCDEATSALDPQTTRSILNLLQKINKEQNITILLVTHEMEVIEQICHRVAVMENGQIIEEGSVLSIFSDPKQTTTKKFVQTILNENIPEKIIHTLDHQENIYQLEFLGVSAKQPVVNELILSIDVKVNILFANMREVDGSVLGSMFVQLVGTADIIKTALAFLKSKGVRVNRGIE